MKLLIYTSIICFLTGLVPYSACQANEAPIDKNLELYTFIGYTREGLSNILWFQICSDKNSKCPCNKTPKSSCLIKLIIRPGQPSRFIKSTKTDSSFQSLRVM